MFLSNTFVLTKMLLSRENWKFLSDLNQHLKQDEHYSFFKMIKLISNILKQEKVVKKGDYYVISSFIPPFPSKALKEWFYKAGDQPLQQFAYAKAQNLVSVYICITDKCSYNCVHCSARNRATGRELTTTEWKKLINDIQQIGVGWIGFTGGEPLLRDDMEEIIGSVKDNSFTLLFTNGKDLTYERALALKRSGLFAISISLDSPYAELHNEMRGDQEAFDKALKAIENASKAGLYTIVQSVIFKKELSEKYIFQLCKLVKRHGADEVRLHQPVPAGNLLHGQDNGDVFLDDNDRKELVRIQHKANRRFFGFPKVSTFVYSEGPEKFGCAAGILHSYITASGDLFPCDFIPISFGNLLECNVMERYQSMKQAIGQPKMSCWARSLYRELYGKDLPINGEESPQICKRFQSKDYARFYKQLQD